MPEEHQDSVRFREVPPNYIEGHSVAFFVTYAMRKLPMYALKLITEKNGRSVEESWILGDMYRLEFYPKGVAGGVIARVEHTQNGNLINHEIKKTDQAYITTLTGDTVRTVCRGQHGFVAGPIQ